MKLLLVTDAWAPQVNGVVRTWQQTIRELEGLGHEVSVVHPALGRTGAAPRYPEIRLSLAPWRLVGEAMERGFDAVHIATEGPLGFEARRRCLARRLPFTTSYHTQFPAYMKRYFALPERFTWGFMRLMILLLTSPNVVKACTSVAFISAPSSSAPVYSQTVPSTPPT
ncbi:MAG: glycosyltransferase, partial [Phycisphaerales bacterium]